jgi:drug/metabolite transporter (DMT)-like permease
MLLSLGLACIAVLGFGSSAVLARLGMQAIRPMPSALVSLVGSTLLAGTLALVFEFDAIIAMPAVAMVWLLGNGMLSYMGGRSQQYIAISLIGASRVTPIVGSAALFSALFSVTLTRLGVPGFNEHLNVLLGLGTVVVVLGLALTSGNFLRQSWGSDWKSVSGYGLALLAAACYGASTLSGRVLTIQFGSPLIMAAGSMFFATLVLGPIFGREAVQKSTSSGWAPLYVFLAGFAAACAVMSLYFAVTREGSNILVIAPIVSCNPLVTLVMARLFLRQVETITKELVIGTLMAVGGVAMVVVGGLIG